MKFVVAFVSLLLVLFLFVIGVSFLFRPEVEDSLIEEPTLSEEQKTKVMNTGIDYVTENYDADYSVNGDVEWGHYKEGDKDYFYPVASFRVPADMQQSGQLVNVMVDPETEEIVKVVTLPSKSTPPNLPDEPPIPEPKEPLPNFEYDIEVDLASAEGFSLSRLEDVNRDIQTFLVLHPGESGTITVTMVSTSNQDYTLSLSLELSGKDSEFIGVDYSFNPSSLTLRGGGKNSSQLQIEADENVPTGHYEISVMAMTPEGGLGLGFPNLLVAPFTPEFIFTVKTSGPNMLLPGWTPPESEVPCFTIEAGKGISVFIFVMDSAESLELNVTTPSTIDYELLTDVVEVFGQTPEPDNFYQLNLKSNPETPTGTYKIALNGIAGSYIFERNLILNVQ